MHCLYRCSGALFLGSKVTDKLDVEGGNDLMVAIAEKMEFSRSEDLAPFGAFSRGLGQVSAKVPEVDAAIERLHALNQVTEAIDIPALRVLVKVRTARICSR